MKNLLFLLGGILVGRMLTGETAQQAVFRTLQLPEPEENPTQPNNDAAIF
jgi:hypothetical protein